MDREIPQEVRNKERNKKILKFAVPAAVVILLIVLVISSLHGKVKSTDLQFSTVDKGSIALTYPGSGAVAPAFEEIINSPINSRILEVYHKNGDKVDAGTPLLKLDLAMAETDVKKAEDEVAMKKCEVVQMHLNNQTQLNDLRMKIKVSEMKLNSLSVELKNERYLDSLGSGTTDKVREVEMNYHTGKLELEQLREEYSNSLKVKSADLQSKQLELNILQRNLGDIRKTLSDAQIRAPRKAVLTYINDQIGAQVGQSTKIAAVADLSHYKVNCSIADIYAGNTTVGSRVIVQGGGKKLEGTISDVAPLSQNGSIEFTVALDKDNDKVLRSGLKVDVFVLGVEKQRTMRVANGSYYSKPGMYDMFVVDGNRLVKKKVRLGDGSYEYVEVLSGLKEGEKVVVNDMSDYKNTNHLKLK